MPALPVVYLPIQPVARTQVPEPLSGSDTQIEYELNPPSETKERAQSRQLSMSR